MNAVFYEAHDHFGRQGNAVFLKFVSLGTAIFIGAYRFIFPTNYEALKLTCAIKNAMNFRV